MIEQQKDLNLGREIGSYCLETLLGRGGMGSVYRARHKKLGRLAAIKLLHAEYSENKETVGRFFQEAKAVNDIHHKNIIDILDYGSTPEGENYILMELLEGESLRARIQRTGALAPTVLGHIALQICAALQAAHEKGIVHRDIKSENVFLLQPETSDVVKVLDFGIAKILHEGGNGDIRTRTGLALGTYLYMPPEQVLGRGVDHRADMYAFGVLLYEMACGRYPFYHENPNQIAALHMGSPVPSPRQHNPSVSRALEDVMLRCMAKDKEQRYASMADVAAALAAALSVDPRPYFSSAVPVAAMTTTPSTSVRWLWLVGVGVLVILFFAYLFTSGALRFLEE